MAFPISTKVSFDHNSNGRPGSLTQIKLFEGVFFSGLNPMYHLCNTKKLRLYTHWCFKIISRSLSLRKWKQYHSFRRLAIIGTYPISSFHWDTSQLLILESFISEKCHYPIKAFPWRLAMRSARWELSILMAVGGGTILIGLWIFWYKSSSQAFPV